MILNPAYLHLFHSAENSSLSAMDLILAINTRTPVRRRLQKKTVVEGVEEGDMERMNLTKFTNGTMVIANTSVVLNGTDVLLQTNLGRVGVTDTHIPVFEHVFTER